MGRFISRSLFNLDFVWLSLLIYLLDYLILLVNNTKISDTYKLKNTNLVLVQ